MWYQAVSLFYKRTQSIGYFVLHLSGFTEKSTEAYNTTAEGLSKIDVKQQQMEIRLTAAPENKCVPQSPL